MFDSKHHSSTTPPPPPGPHPQVPAALAPVQEVHILDRLGVIYKHRRAAITVFLLAVIGMAVHTYTTVPVYRAQARILIEDERPALEGFKDTEVSYLDPEPYYATQHRILQGRGLARRVVRRLGLNAPAQVNGQTPPPSGLSAAILSIRQAVVTPVAGFFRNAPQQTDAPTPNETAEESALADSFLSRVGVRPVRDTRLVDVLFDSTDPAFAARAANALAEGYIEQNLELKLQATHKTLDWLSGEIKKQEEKLQASERALTEYRERQNAMSLGDRQNIVVSQLNQVNDQLTRVRGVRIQKEALYNQVKSIELSGEAIDSLPSILQNQVIQGQKARLAELEREKARLSERYLAKHPEMTKLETNIQETSRQLSEELKRAVEGIRNEYRAALDEEQRLAAELERGKAATVALGRKEGDYVVLQRQAETDRQIYQTLLQREKELTVASNSRANNVRLMDRAEPPKGPFSPDTRRNMFIAIVFGLALALGLAFGIEYLDDSIKTPEEVTQKLKLPFLGLVPAVRGDKLPLLLGPVPHDFAESFRALRTALVFSSGGESNRIIAVTSAQPLEGKTTTSCNLAAVLAFGGVRVLLLDADMRRPGVHRAVGLQNNIGLSHVLVGQARIREAVQRTQDPNLYVMAAGRTPPNPSELLASERMKNLLASLASGPFDWVIVDTPPVLAVTDAVILMPMVTGVALVLGAEMTRQRLAERAIEMLMTSKPRLLGVVLNRVDFDRNKYYYSRYYGYQYKSYYGRSTASA